MHLFLKMSSVNLTPATKEPPVQIKGVRSILKTAGRLVSSVTNAYPDLVSVEDQKKLENALESAQSLSPDMLMHLDDAKKVVKKAIANSNAVPEPVGQKMGATKKILNTAVALATLVEQSN